MSLETLHYPNGFTAYVDTMPSMYTNVARMFVPYGSVQEKPGEEGAAHAFEHCVHLQTDMFEDRSALRLHARLNGMYTNANTYYTRTLYIADGVNIDNSVRYLDQVLMHTKFPASAVEHEMKAVRREAKTKLDNIDGLHSVAMDMAMFGAPYGRRVIGYSDHLNFTAEKLRGIYKHNYDLGAMSLLVSGVATAEEVDESVRRYFNTSGGASTTSAYNAAPVVDENWQGGTSALIRDDSENVRYLWAYPLRPSIVNDLRKDSLCLGLAASVMSDACFQALRYDAGISYNGSVSLGTYNHPNAWNLNAGATTDAGNIEKARKIFAAAFSKTGAEYTDDEIMASLATRQYELLCKAESSDGRVENHTARLERFRLPEDMDSIAGRVKSVTPLDVRNAIDVLVQHAAMTPHFEHLTGPASDVGYVDRIIDQSEIA